MTKEKIKSELNKYSKDEIIACLVDYVMYFNSYPLNTMFSRLKCQRDINNRNTMQKEYDKVNEEFDESLKKFSDWKERVIEKYGEEGQVKLINIPVNEIQIGAELEKDFNEKRITYLNILDKEIK